MIRRSLIANNTANIGGGRTLGEFAGAGLVENTTITGNQSLSAF